MTTAQTWALSLSERLKRDCEMNWPDYDNQMAASVELRRLAAVEAECDALRAQVEALTKPASRWNWLSDLMQVHWSEGKFTSLVRIVSEEWRDAINASVDRMMAGDLPDAGTPPQNQAIQAAQERWTHDCPAIHVAAVASWSDKCRHCGAERSAPSTPSPLTRPASFPERDPTRPAEQQGLFRKFTVSRVDGSDAPGCKHHGCEYFVLDMDHDKAAPAALVAYADAVVETHPQLAADLRARFGKSLTRPAVPEGLATIFREALAFGYAYGPRCSADLWDEMREEMVVTYMKRAIEQQPKGSA